MAIVSSLRCVDMVMKQNDLGPTENLKKLHEQFKNAKLIITYGSNWKKVPGEKYIKEIGEKLYNPRKT